MLKVIRRNASAAWVKIMFVAIVVVFIFWGMGGIVSGDKAQVVAHVNEEVIDPLEFDRAYNNLMRLYQEVYKENFQPEMAKTLDLKGRAMDQLIRGRLMRREAERIGLRVSDTEVRDAIAGLPAFQDSGRFNRELYLRALRFSKLTPADFEQAEREELLVRKLQDLIESGVHVSEGEVHDRYRFNNEKVNLRFIKLDAAAFLSEVNLGDDEVQAYFDKHQDTFREPERVRVEYVAYAPEHFSDKVDTSDAAVQQYFDTRQAEYTKPEQVRARHILFKVPPDTSDDLKTEVRKKADEVLAKVKAGEDFGELAKQYSEDSSAADGGDLGFFTRGKMVKPFEDAAFSLAPGASSDVIESPFGFHIIKVEAKEDARPQTLGEVREHVVAALKKDNSRELARTRAEADQAKAAKGEALVGVAQVAGLNVATPAPFARTEAIAGLGRNAELTKAAFATDAGTVGPVVESPDAFLVFRVNEKIAAHVPQLSEIRERVAQAVRTERAEALAKDKAEALLAELQKSDIDSVAQSVGLAAGLSASLKVEETGPFSREGPYVPQAGSVPGLKKDAFQLTAEKPVAPKVYTAAGSSIIAVFKERVPADEEKFAADKDNLMRQAQERRKQQVMEEFVNYLKARATIDISQDFLAGVPDSGRVNGSSRRR